MPCAGLRSRSTAARTDQEGGCPDADRDQGPQHSRHRRPPGARREALRARSSKQVSTLAELEVELMEERNPAIADSQVAEVTLHLKGVTLRAQ